MKIIYLGNFKIDFTTENHIKKTLESLGHEVIPLQEDGYGAREIYKTVKRESPDLFLFTRTWGESLDMETLESIKQRVPTVSYHLDLYYGLERDGGIDHDPFWKTDFVFTPDGDPKSAEWFKEKGVNHIYMKPGVFEPECYFNGEKGIGPDVTFVGSYYYHKEWPYRKQLIDWLRDNYKGRFAKFGNPESTVRGDKLNLLYTNSKVVVGDALCLNFDHTYYWSDRLYETLGRGGFLIHPYIKGIEEEFKDGKHLVLYEYENFKQLRELIDYYIEHDKEREKIREAGHKIVKENYTYTDRMKQMLKRLGEKC